MQSKIENVCSPRIVVGYNSLWKKYLKTLSYDRNTLYSLPISIKVGCVYSYKRKYVQRFFICNLCITLELYNSDKIYYFKSTMSTQRKIF